MEKPKIGKIKQAAPYIFFREKYKMAYLLSLVGMALKRYLVIYHISCLEHALGLLFPGEKIFDSVFFKTDHIS